MDQATGIANTVIHILLLLLFPPLIPGFINKTKAWFGGRKGPPLLQTWYDLVKLMRKGLVLSTSTGWIFRFGPVITLAAILMAGLMIPLGGGKAPLGFSGDLILFVYLFALARFFTTGAALQTGSAFEGMGSSRDLSFAVLSEPALILAFLVLSQLSGSLSMNDMLHVTAKYFPTGTAPSLVLIALAIFVVLLAETCRLPVDDPNTHLELTMIHEAMILDNAGPLLGMSLYGASAKFLVLGAMLLNIMLPFRTGLPWFDAPLFMAEMAGLAVLVGILESMMARLRMIRVPYLLVTAILLSGSAFVLLLR